jgi:glycosyltransferase involved in cell wall biosynthesis
VPSHSYFQHEQWHHHERPHYESATIAAAHVLDAINAIQADGRFDIIHDHNVYHGPTALEWATQSPSIPPAIHTLHGPPFTTNKALVAVDNRPFWQTLGRSPHLHYVGISDALTRHAPEEIKPRLLPTVHHGVQLDDFPFEPHKRKHFITLARFTHDKGQHHAVQYCDDMGFDLKMAGAVAGLTTPRQLFLELANPSSRYRTLEDFRYYSDYILATIIRNPRIQYMGNVSGKRKQNFLSKAKALLFPVEWEEPFGMAVIEALACGTPVIAMNRGAMPEIIEHGVNGFLAKTEDEFRYYMQIINEIDPAACRRSVQERFTTQVMTQNYINRYRSVLGQ